MPSFQQGRYLEEAIRSVLLQNYPRLEFAIFDGGSTDESRAVLAEYTPWVGFIRQARDRGQSHAINLGLSLSSGDLVGWLNSDDLLLPGTLWQVAAAWNAGATFVYGDAVTRRQSTGQLVFSLSNIARPSYVRFPGLIIQPGSFWGGAVREPIWEAQHCAMDYELWIRLLPKCRLGYLRRPLAIAREHAEAKTYDPRISQRWAEDASRNRDAHPELYAETWRNRWLKFEFSIVQRLHALLSRRRAARQLREVQAACRGGSKAASPAGPGEARAELPVTHKV